MPSSDTLVQTITDDNFTDTIQQAEKPVLIDFYADWCGPCQMVSPIIEKLAEKYQDQVFFGKVDIDNNQEIASQYSIMSVPTIMIFTDQDGEIQAVAKQLGFNGQEAYEQMIDQALDNQK